ncbi:MAG TPA: YbaN family protein [Steroidobacteraceae bacterium]|nr:YbaN family protein [Steroidobacteraceae bacterium]
MRTMERNETPTEIREHDSPVLRALFVTAGFTCVGCGLAGLFLPVLPTTPFMILAAACFARGSQRFHRWVLEHPVFGPTVNEWQVHRSIPWRAKLSAIVLMSLTLTTSIVFFVESVWLQGALAVLGLTLAIWMYRIPSRDRPQRS